MASGTQRLAADANKIDSVNPVFSFFEPLRYSLNPAHHNFGLGETNGYTDSSGGQGPRIRGKH